MDSLRHQIPPHGIYIDRCINSVWFLFSLYCYSYFFKHHHASVFNLKIQKIYKPFPLTLMLNFTIPAKPAITLSHSPWVTLCFLSSQGQVTNFVRRKWRRVPVWNRTSLQFIIRCVTMEGFVKCQKVLVTQLTRGTQGKNQNVRQTCVTCHPS